MSPHLFTFYTTNGYQQEGDNLGGYNQDVDGWIQIDSTIFPGAMIVGGSAQSYSLDVPVDESSIQIQYQLLGGFWFFMVNGVTIGGYPASLFIGDQGPGLTLGDHAEEVQFGGEVYTPLSNPSLTNTEMGSGCFGDEGFNYAASIQDLTTIDGAGAMSNLVGASANEAPHMYDIITVPSAFPPGTFPGAFFVGGPGNGPIFRSVVLHDDNPDGYVLDGYGDIVIVGNSPLVTQLSFLPSWNICRGIAESAFEWGVGYVLDGFGGIHPWGPTGVEIPPTNGPSWSWDIARGIVMIRGGLGANQSGYVLDGWGGIHPWWVPGVPQPPVVTLSAYWPGWDIARGIVIRADGMGGYVLDGWGGVHSWGNAPAPTAVTAYWQGWDIARAIALLPNGTSGYVLDGWGGIHPWGGASNVTPSYYTPGQDTATSLALTPDGTQGAVLDSSGGVHPFTIS